MSDLRKVKAAVLDLYNGIENQGMRCILEILDNSNLRFQDTIIEYDVFEVRSKNEVPSLDYDIYISSGGPGSPFDGEGQPWEDAYFTWMDAVWNHNIIESRKKYVLSICHSFQLMCRHFDLAEVRPRKSGSFGILPVYLTDEGTSEPLFEGLSNPFYAADFREWQVLQPKLNSIKSLGAKILAIEKKRPHVALERAVMAMSVSDEIIGTQFHPEADPQGMLFHFSKEEQKAKIIDKHGAEKFDIILERLKDPQYLLPTYEAFIPNFLQSSIRKLNPALETV